MIDALSVAQVQRLLERAPVLFFVTDAAGKFRAISGSKAAHLHLNPTSIHDEDAAAYFARARPAAGVTEAFAAACSGHAADFSFTRHGTRYDAHLFPLHRDGSVQGLAGVAIETRTQTAHQLEEARRVLSHAEALATIASYAVDLETESCEITSGFARIFGFPEETRRIHFAELLARIHPEDRMRFSRARGKALAVGGEMNIEYRVVRPSGEIRFVHAYASTFKNDAGKSVRGVGVVIDETQALEQQRGLEYVTMHDPLTGVLNRPAFDRRVRAAVAESEANHRGIALLFLDLDGFGEVNDLAGFSAGDQILRVVAERLRAVRGADHSIGRMGGDEFAMLFFDVVNHREAETYVANVRNALRSEVTVGGVSYSLTASMGIAMFNVHESEAALLTRAHMAMLGAKAAGRSRVMWYTPDLERLMTMRHRIERDLTTSLDRSELIVHYQPILDARTRELTAVEALLRWEHPEFGLIAPTGFLDVAAQSGQLPLIGEWVFEQACRDTLELSARTGRPIRVNVNVSAEQLQAADFAERAIDLTAAVGIDPTQVQIEVTEQSLINDVEHAALVLSTLRRAGFSIAIDDFGTGYNTLSYLKSYPVTCLKIDRMFVRDCETDEYSRAICRSLTALARSLGLRVIGEGIETAGQHAFLHEVGCDEVQGFLYGRPVAVDEVDLTVSWA